jgi:thioesterase domain-containing protein/acyl carrier protein
VVVEHSQLASFVEAQLRAGWMARGDRVLHFASVAFDTCIGEIFPALCVGATIVIRPDVVMTPDAGFRKLLEEHRVSYVDVPTAFWHEWVKEISASRFPVIPSLDRVVIGGEAANPARVREWFEGPYARGVKLVNAYGPTETTVTSVFAELDAELDPRYDLVRIGRPMANARVYILDGHLQLVPTGSRGEIYIGGAGVARGYLDKPALTEERFLPDPFSDEPGARIYRTGDLGRWREDGDIEYLGRDDFQVKIRGFRIELGEIEARLRGCEGVRDAVVVAGTEAGVPARLVAYTVAEPGGPVICAPALRQALARVLPEYMLPSAFVLLDVLPLTSRGKLDRKALPAPDRDSMAARAYEAPRSETEIGLAAIWQELLGVPAVGLHDHFFELGGHSLLAVRMAARVQERFGKSVSLGDLFGYPTMEAFAQRVENLGEGDASSPMVVIREAACTSRTWFFHAVDGGVRYAAELARWMDDDVSVIAFEAFPLVREGTLPRTLEALAALYAARIRGVQPAGPHTLVGWSAGGLLAFEVARQLLEAGGEAPRLALIDTPCGYDLGSAPSDLAPTASSHQDHAYVDNILRRIVPGASREQRTRLAEIVEDRPPDLAEACRRRDVPINADELRSLVDMLETHDRLHSMMRDCRIQACGLAPYLLLAETGAPPLDATPWEEVLGRPLRVDVVAGDHHSMLENEGAKRLAALVSAYAKAPREAISTPST